MQLVQPLAPPAENEPAAQGSCALVVGQYEPGWHAGLDTEPAGQYCPRVQFVQPLAFATENMPAAHCWQAEAPAAEYKPALHVWHVFTYTLITTMPLPPPAPE